MNEAIPQDLIPLLRCPKCRHSVTLRNDRIVCGNADCGLRYPVREGIPVMLIEEAEPPAPRTSEPVSRP
jgi:uncharacterized protein YbaR (Trm112 family)